MSLFKKHDEWTIKQKGQSITKIITEQVGVYKTKCFFVVREDGSITDISYKACIKSVSPKENVIRACRTAERPRIEAFTESITFPYIYTFNGTTTIINNKSDMDVDHYDLDFNEVVKLRVQEKGGFKKLAKAINSVEDNDSDTRFIDKNLAEDFAAFSKVHSKLRVLSKKDNRSTRRKKA